MKRILCVFLFLFIAFNVHASKEKGFKKKDGKLEITTTETVVMVEEKTLTQLNEEKENLESNKIIILEQHSKYIARHDSKIAEIQELIDQAVSLGIEE